MFVGVVHSKRTVRFTGYMRNGLLNPFELRSRHDALVEEMDRRGYAHKTPLAEWESTYLDKFGLIHNTPIDFVESTTEILSRCEECYLNTLNTLGIELT